MLRVRVRARQLAQAGLQLRQRVAGAVRQRGRPGGQRAARHQPTVRRPPRALALALARQAVARRRQRTRRDHGRLELQVRVRLQQAQLRYILKITVKLLKQHYMSVY